MWHAWKTGTPGARLRPQRSDQLRGLPGAALAGVLRLEPEPNVRSADEGAARALLLAGLHRHATDSSPAALGNRIAAAAIAAGRHDGSNESLHYADPTFTSQNQPLIVHAAGSTVEDATFWQPLALGTIQPHSSLTAEPADVQSFVGAEWGHVRTFALPRSRRGLPIDPGASPLRDPSSARVQARGRGRPAGDLGERSGRRGPGRR